MKIEVSFPSSKPAIIPPYHELIRKRPFSETIPASISSVGYIAYAFAASTSAPTSPME